MLILLSPAKTFAEKKVVPLDFPVRLPEFNAQAAQLVAKLKHLSVAEIASLLSVSDSIAQLNQQRFQQWLEQPQENALTRPAAYAFWGDVNKNLDPFTLSREDLEYADSKLLYLSGLYGVLRPLDAIQYYRLEMGVSFATSADCTNLYQYWHDTLLDYFNQRIKAEKIKFICNLASKEYAQVVDFKKLACPTVDIVFKDQKNEVHKVISVIAKRSRGLFARWLIENKLTDFEQLKEFNVDGYYFKADESDNTTLTFYRDEA